jgi:hypothetical protein
VSIFVSKIFFLKEDTFGLNLIFNCKLPSYKKQSSKSAATEDETIRLEYN